MPFATRGWLRGAAVAAAVVGAYLAGVGTGVVGSGVAASQSASATPTFGVLDEAATRIKAAAARPVDDEALRRAAVEGMLRALGDRWSRYFQAEDFGSFEQALEGRYTGVGLWLSTVKSVTVVSSVQPGSPATRAGVLAGDRLLAVDGVETTDEPLGQVAEQLRGQAGTTVALGLRRDGTALNVTVTREQLTNDDVTVDRITGGVEVVRIAGFTRGVGRQLRDALIDDPARTDAAARPTTGLVLDLRGNPGGLLTEAVEVASVFLDGGPVVSYETRDSGTRTLDALGRGDTRTPVVVLVDGATASAAEVVAAALQDRNRAVVVGQRTFGKGSVQQASRLSDGSALELTVGRYRTPSGALIDGTGVEPDVLVDATPSTTERRAVEVLRGLVAATGSKG